MQWKIRPARAEDYPALAAAANAAFPGVPHTAEDLQEEDAQIAPPLRMRRWVAERDGQVVGTVSYFQLPSRFHPQKFWMDAWVHPEHQRQGIGGALLAQAGAALAPFEPILLRTFTREDLTHAVAFFAHRGFVEGKRTWESHLDLERFDPAPYAGVAGRVEGQGIAIYNLAELQGRPGWEQSFLDLINAIEQDVPDFDPATPLTPEQLRRSYLESQSFMPEANFVALDGERWVGLSALWKWTGPGMLNTGLTGVRREYRGRGIALALKLRGIAYARQHGYRKLRTTNASTNQRMLAINQRLGFVQQPGWIHLIKRLDQS